MAGLEQYYVQWRGGKLGPWDLAAIREALRSGGIHSMYQIETGGQWQPLREFLESWQAGSRDSARTAEPQELAGQHAQEMQDSLRSTRTSSQFPRSSGSGHMDWKHVGIALLLLLGIAAGGFGSYAIVKSISAPAFEMQ